MTTSLISLPSEALAIICAYLPNGQSARLLSACKELWERKSLIEEELQRGFRRENRFEIAACFATQPSEFEQRFEKTLSGMSLRNYSEVGSRLLGLIYSAHPAFGDLIVHVSAKTFRKLLDKKASGHIPYDWRNQVYIPQHRKLEMSFGELQDRADAREKLFALGEWNRRCYANNRRGGSNDENLSSILYVAAKLNLTTPADHEIIKSWFHPQLEAVISMPDQPPKFLWELLVDQARVGAKMSGEEQALVKSHFAGLFL
jgi:hypothetical protein